MKKIKTSSAAQTQQPHPPRNKTAASKAEPAELTELRPGQSIELLKELHILTRDGRLNQDSRRKLKQVYHLFNFIEPLLTELSTTDQGPTLADHGAGKSYLGFILYDLYFKALGRGHIYGVETRAELVEKSRTLAQKLGFERMSFLNVSVAESTDADELPARIDVVTALHACDTATDDAIAFGLQKQARAMVLVPCCQAEMAACLRQGKALQLARTPLAELWRHPLHTRELGSQVTNVLRCLYLEASGYQVTVTELVGWGRGRVDYSPNRCSVHHHVVDHIAHAGHPTGRFVGQQTVFYGLGLAVQLDHAVHRFHGDAFAGPDARIGHDGGFYAGRNVRVVGGLLLLLRQTPVVDVARATAAAGSETERCRHGEQEAGRAKNHGKPS